MERASVPPARARALERVREIVMNVINDDDVRVYLFGSCVTGPMRGSSDIDVAIESAGRRLSDSLAALRECLEESDVPYDVDVIDLSAVPPEFAQRVRHEGVLWKG